MNVTCLQDQHISTASPQKQPQHCSALVIASDPIRIKSNLDSNFKLKRSFFLFSKTGEPRLLLTLPVTTADEGSEKLIGRSSIFLLWIHRSFLSRVLPLVGLSSVLLTVMVIVLVVTTLISRSSQVLICEL